MLYRCLQAESPSKMTLTNQLGALNRSRPISSSSESTLSPPPSPCPSPSPAAPERLAKKPSFIKRKLSNLLRSTGDLSSLTFFDVGVPGTTEEAFGFVRTLSFKKKEEKRSSDPNPKLLTRSQSFSTSIANEAVSAPAAEVRRRPKSRQSNKLFRRSVGAFPVAESVGDSLYSAWSSSLSSLREDVVATDSDEGRRIDRQVRYPYLDQQLLGETQIRLWILTHNGPKYLE